METVGAVVSDVAAALVQEPFLFIMARRLGVSVGMQALRVPLGETNMDTVESEYL